LILLLIGAGGVVAWSNFWSYEKEIFSVPHPLSATIITDLDNKIGPYQVLTFRVLITNVDTQTYYLLLEDSSSFVENVGWDNITLSGSAYSFGNAYPIPSGDNVYFNANVVGENNIGAGSSIIRIAGSFESG